MDRRIREALAEEYRLQREKNAAEEARRREEIRERAPQVWALMEKRQDMIRKFCRQALTDEDFTTPENELHRMNENIRNALREAGYPADYLEPVVRCPKCNDTGVMGEDERRECDCYRQRAMELSSAVGDAGQSFEAFDERVFPETIPEGRTTTQREQMLQLKAYCEQYTDQVPDQQPRDLLLYGKSGLGKTFLLNCIACRLQERGYRVEVVSAYDVIRLMRDAYFGREDDTARLYEADLLLIDDLGMEPMMENITIEQLFQLVNTRRSRGQAMVFSTNLNTEEIKRRYNERLASRLFDRSLCKVVRLLGQDVRQSLHPAQG